MAWGARRAPCQRPDARHELGELERLAQVVVGSQLEALHAVADRARSCEHEHTGVGAFGEQRPAYLVAVHVREIAVEDDDVVGVDSDTRERLAAVEREIDRHPLAPQSLRQGGRQTTVVLDDEQSHIANKHG